MTKVHGVTDRQDLAPGLTHRETRPLRYRFKEFVAETGPLVIILLSVFTLICPFVDELPVIPDFIFIFGLIFSIYAVFNISGAPYRDPIFQQLGADKDIDDAAGIFNLGQDLSNGSSLWFSNDDMRRHTLVFGTTGSGKTVFLLGVLYQALIIGSGVIYVDGKADTDVFWDVFSLVRRLGREDDLLVINYLKADLARLKNNPSERVTNTTNPFAIGDAEDLRSLIVGLMRAGGGDNEMWKGRTSEMLNGLLTALCVMRDRDEINLSISTIRDYFPLDKLIELVQRTDLPATATEPLKKFLNELPGFRPEDLVTGNIHPDCYKQFTFLTMQLSEVMGVLGETYKKIFNTPLGEVDFKDVVYQRRILFVMLPSLQVEPDRLAGLGKLIVAGIRSALSTALGDGVEGKKTEVIDLKPSKSKVPILLILDEYGYYSVDGFAVVAAQARSLGVAALFGGQDYPSFKSDNENEAKSTIGNCNTKLGFKIEEQETMELLQKRGGESDVSTTYGHDKSSGATSTGSTFVDKGETRVEQKVRINTRDVAAQEAGEFHAIVGDRVIRARSFYTGHKVAREARLNHLLMVPGPNREEIDRLKGTRNRVRSLLEGKPQSLQATTKTKHRRRAKKKLSEGMDTSLRQLFTDYHDALDREQPADLASIYSIGMLEYRQIKGDELMEKKALSPNQDLNTEVEQRQKQQDQEQSSPMDLKGILGDIQYTLGAEESLADDARVVEDDFSKLLEKTIISSTEKSEDRALSAKEKADLAPNEQLRKIEEQIGNPGNAVNDAKKAMQVLADRIDYPAKPFPVKLTSDQVQEKVSSLLGRVETQSKF